MRNRNTAPARSVGRFNTECEYNHTKKKTKAFSVLYFAFTFRSQTKSIESLNSSVGNLIVGAQCDWFARPAYPQRIHLVCTSIRWYATYDGCDAIIYTRLAVGKPMCLL